MRSKYHLYLIMVIPTVFFFLYSGCKDKGVSASSAPDFLLQDLNGEMVSLDQYKDRIILLDFWATWCGPCRMSIPELVELQDKYRDNGLVVIGVSLDDLNKVPNKHLLSFKEKFKINYRILRFNKKIIQDYFGNTPPAIPTMFIIDREFKIRDKIVGFNSRALKKSLAEVLK